MQLILYSFTSGALELHTSLFDPLMNWSCVRVFATPFYNIGWKWSMEL